MRKTFLLVAALGLCGGQMCGTSSPDLPTGEEKLIYTNTNIQVVSGNPTSPTSFTLNNPCTITKIRTYHWNGGSGTASTGTISLTGGGATYGPWSTTGANGQGNAVNAYWDCTPNIDLPAGTYTILDSDPATWSQNAPSGSAGIVWVYGIGEEDPGGDTGSFGLDYLHTMTFCSVVLEGAYSDAYGPYSSDIAVSTSSFSSGGDLVLDVQWNGTSFSASGQIANRSVQISGKVSADGRSVYAVSAKHTWYDDVEEVVTNDKPIPLVHESSADPWDHRVWYEITGAQAKDYIVRYENDHPGVTLGFENPQEPPLLKILFAN